MIENTEELQGQLIASGQVVASLIAQKGAKGDPGEQGSPGEDGFSPLITTSKENKTTTVTIIDAEGTKTATILDGSDGQNGQDGNDGVSPVASVSKVGKIATITITDAYGTTTTEIRDGEDGSGSGDMLKSTYDTNNNGIVDNAEKVNNHTVGVDVPANAIFTDTTYTAGTGIEITAGNVINNTQSGGGLEELTIDWTSVNNYGVVELYSLDNGVYIVPEDEHFLTKSAYIRKYSSYNSQTEAYSRSRNEIKPGDVVFINLHGGGTPYLNDSFSIISGGNMTSLGITKIVDDPEEPEPGEDYVETYDWTALNGIKYVSNSGSPYQTFDSNVCILAIDYTLQYIDEDTEENKSISLPSGSMSLGNIKELVTGERNEVIFISSTGKMYKMTSCSTSSTPYATIIEIIPTKTSQLTNDSNFISTSNTAGLIKNDGTIDTTSYSTFSGSYNDLSNKPTIPDELADLSDDSTHRVVTDAEKTTWSGKQDALISGTNIKTINGTSVLGSGNIDAGASIPIQDTAPASPEENDLWIDTSEPEEMQEALNTYTTFEKKVGKWINNKPLYRKTIYIDRNDMIFANNVVDIDLSSLYADTIMVDYNHSYFFSTLEDNAVLYKSYNPLSTFGYGSTFANHRSLSIGVSTLVTSSNQSEDMISIFVGSEFQNDNTVTGLYLTVEYTKTTD